MPPPLFSPRLLFAFDATTLPLMIRHTPAGNKQHTAQHAYGVNTLPTLVQQAKRRVFFFFFFHYDCHFHIACRHITACFTLLLIYIDALFCLTSFDILPASPLRA